MSELDVVPDEREEDIADLTTAQTDQAEPLAEAPDEGEETTAAPEDQGGDETERKTRSEERKERIKAEIDALTREKYEAQRAADESQQRLAEMQHWIQQQQNSPQPGEMPKLADYDYDEGRYQSAVQQWHAENVQSMQQQQQAAMRQRQQHAAQVYEQQAVAAKLAEGVKKYPDFAVKVNDPNLPNLREVSPAAFEAVMTSDAGVDVAYYLANNTSEIYDLAKLTPVQAVKRVAQLEALVAKQPPGVTRMPPKPPSTVKGSAGAIKDPQKMSTDEWMAYRNRQVAKRQGRK